MNNAKTHATPDQTEQTMPWMLRLLEKSFWIMLFLGFSAGLPYSLVFGTLSLWLQEAGISKSTITFFSWAGLGYSFKFIWAPLIDQARLPWLSLKLGKRRAWLLVTQVLLVIILLAMAMTDPKQGHTALITMALLAVALGFTSATQDIVIDAYRIEITPTHLLSMSAASYSLGYRLAMILAGGVAFILSDFFGSSLNNYQYAAWQWTYAIMSLAGCLGIVTTLVIREPVNSRPALGADGSKQLLLLFMILLIPFISIFYYWQPLWSQVIDFQQMSPLSLFLFKVLRFIIAALACYLTARLLIQSTWVSTDIAATAYWQPVKEFIQRYPLRLVILLLLLIGFYRVSDMVLGVVANMFYQQLGYSKTDIGIVSKTFGIGVTLLGTVIGGLLTVRIGVMRMMMLGAVLSAATNLLFILLAYSGAHLPLLFVVISADNLAAGFASIAFVTFLSRLSNIRFTAMQYAIFSSLMALLPRVIGGYSGTIVEAYSYPTFFLITTVLGIPVIVLVWLVGKQLTFADDNATMPTSH